MGIEQEIIIPLSPDIQYCTRLDKILQSKESGLLYNMNYKTTSYMNDLRSSLEYSMQLMMEAEAARIAMGANVSGSIVLGFDKGSKRAVSEAEKKRGLTGKRILSPYTYAYYKGGEEDPWDPLSVQYSIAYRNGWKRFGVFDTKGGSLLDCCDKWWNMLDERIKMGTFSILPPIYHSEETIESIKKQIISMENLFQADPIDIEEIPGMLDIAFPQNLKNCNQHAGFMHHTCPYKPLCWDNEEPESLIGGMYKWREINHPYEDQFVAHPEHEMVA